MAISHGMNVEAVRQLGNRLQQRFSPEIENLMRQMEGMVNETSSTWVGPDAERFRGWWPEKRAALQAIATDIHGFGQSAINNVSEQQQASGEGGSTAPGGGRAPSSVAGPGGTSSGADGTGVTTPLPGAERTWEEVQRDYEQNYVDRYGLRAGGADGGEYEYQCVSWAWFRMRELGYTGEQGWGNGKDIAGVLGGTTDTIPEPGAVLSYDRSGGGYGHVAIAEQVYTNSDGDIVVRVSEMNTGSDGSSALDGNPQEYSYGREMVRRDGKWLVYGTETSVTVANPEYGG